MIETVYFEISKADEENLKRACSEIGITVDGLFETLVKKISFEKHIYFDINADPFYSESNIRYLEKKLSDYKSGKLRLFTHDIIED